jgi:glycosyltransferase involved in cell wall biosynthesis
VKILFLDQFSEMGGAQRMLVDTVDAARGRGWEAYAAIPGDGPLIAQLRSRGVAVKGIRCGPYRSSRKGGADFMRFALDLLQQICIIRDLSDQECFDLIYVNGPRLLPAAALAHRPPAPVLFHAHSHIRELAASRLARWSIRRVGASVIGCSNSVIDPLRLHVARDKLHVIPNGVQAAQFRKRQFGRGKGWRIGMIARISPEKGQVEFLQAAALLAREFLDAHFVICGAPLFADSSYSEHVQNLAAGLPVEFLGWREDISTVLNELDLLAAPSIDEGMGRVLAEAFSAGVPVIAFSVGGIPEVVIDAETGFLTRETSPEALAARIRDVIVSDPQALRQVVANARKAWERSYTLTQYQERITAVIESLVLGSRPERETETLQARK